MILKGILIILILAICPLMIGDIIAKWTKTGEHTIFDHIVYRYVFGHITMWAVFEIVAVPLILMKKSFMTVVYIWGALIVLLLICDVVALILGIKQTNLTKFKLNWNFKRFITDKNNLFTCAIVIVAIGLISFQCYNYVAYMHIDDDDARYIVNACEAYDNNSMLLINPATGEYEGTWIGELAKDVTSPWSIYVAVISKIVHIYPTIVAHTILPSFLLLMAYGAYWLIAKRLFKSKDTQSACLFVMFAALINMFYNASVYTDATFLLTRIWQGKAVVAGVIIPIIFYELFSLYQNWKNFRKFFVLGIVALAASMLSGIGIISVPIIIVIYGGWYVIVKKEWKYFIGIIATCIPNVIIALIYSMIK